jgi:hypothetical protein
MGVKVHDRVRAEPFARPESFAAGWNDACAGRARNGRSTDYNLGFSEAIRRSATRADAFNQLTVRQ